MDNSERYGQHLAQETTRTNETNDSTQKNKKVSTTKISGHISTGGGKEKTPKNLQKTLASHLSISIIICKQQKECR